MAGFNWLAHDWVQRGRPPAVITYAISTSVGTVAGGQLNRLATVITNLGLLIVNAAGNSNTNGCQRQLNNNPAVLSVAASTWQDRLATFSCSGPCVQLAAPGDNVLGADVTSRTATQVASGTSYACPYASGFAAVLRGRNTDLTPAQTITSLLCRTTRNALSTGGRSPTNLLFAGRPGLQVSGC